MKLYVIGNGFDVHHGLDTKYTSFGLYLKKNYRDVYNLLLEHFGFTDLDPDFPSSMLDPLWSEFESSMSGLSTDSVLEAN
ncbi:bacteriophage abortive infection AbiH family protein, partial [Acinetobacter johnsonii]